MIAGRTAHDVEHFEDRNATADQLREGPRKAGHANLMNKRTENRELEFPTIPELFATSRAQKSANAEDRAPNTEDKEVPLRTNKVTNIDQKLCRRRKLGSEVGENFAEDRNNSHDQERGNGEGNADDDDRIGHRRFDFLAQSGAGFKEAGETVKNFRKQTTMFTCFHHANEKAIEDTRMLG